MENQGLNHFFHGLFPICIFGYGSYWMYICCGEHWRRAIGPQNLILILFNLAFVAISLILFSRNMKKHYAVMAFLSFIPGAIVCFINRATRYPDFVRLIDSYNEGHINDAVVLGYQMIYSENFLKYDYIVSRSSTSAMIMAILQFLWFITLMHKLLSNAEK
ncbi:hypothetical protein TRFO_28173 [Tritrichomonas foetus]|uniref:Uncharacterized protein n=1 Tax=Tritrichomonas foetus TaxID=1144522 RepID=A0A1J4K076_9EUKA|nr:hypothetical protein TRFO_28173 [Tritrichomonas foetus]|eukprot:OHT04346.1 hypothetical protein TRFO_28173 [Tritrichomonas foetus]